MSKDSTTQRVRLNKLIADSGLASRRQADQMIEEGQVVVNGKKVYELGIRVDPNIDKILVNGKPLRKPLQSLYLLLNKPPGVLTTMEDPLDRPTVAQFLGEVPGRVFPVGRLDWESEGMLLLTNDGDFANRVTHPKGEVTKTYLVKINGLAQPNHIQKLLTGVPIIGGRVKARSLEKIKAPGEKRSDKYEWYKIVITEGKNRQIRQMFAKIGFDVLKLQRVAIGRLRIGNLRRGQLVFLNDVAKERVFLPDLPEELKVKKTYQGKKSQEKKSALKKYDKGKKIDLDKI